jgi:hypothetical protein
MKYYKLNTGALMGLTTIKIDDVSAYTISVQKEGMLRADTYNIEIHMNSGTIFTTNMDEAKLLQWEELFFLRRFPNDEEE